MFGATAEQFGGAFTHVFVAVAVARSAGAAAVPSVAVIVFVPGFGGVFENVNVALPVAFVGEVPVPLDGTAVGPLVTVKLTVSPTNGPSVSKTRAVTVCEVPIGFGVGGRRERHHLLRHDDRDGLVADVDPVRPREEIERVRAGRRRRAARRSRSARTCSYRGAATGPSAGGNVIHEAAAGAGLADATSRWTLFTVAKAVLMRLTICVARFVPLGTPWLAGERA